MGLSFLIEHHRRPFKFNNNYRLIGDFPEAPCTRGFHFGTLGIVEEGRPKIGIPYYVRGPKDDLW
jgi:hypothetical protein